MVVTETSNRLMVVEDNPATLRALGTVFARAGWEVLTATTVAEALHLLSRAPAPDFLILDLLLPDGSGEAVLRRLREAGLPTRVIVCSGACDPSYWITSRKFAPDLMLCKPVEAQTLRHLCTNWSMLAGPPTVPRPH